MNRLALSKSGLAAAALSLAMISACGGDAVAPAPVERQAGALSPADLIPAACVADPTTLSCASAAYSAAQGAFGTAKSILSFLGIIESGPSIDQQLAQLSAQLTEIQRGLASLHTQVAALDVSIAGYATQNVKILVWNRLSDLTNLQNDIYIARTTGDIGTMATTLRYTNDLAGFLTNDILYQDGPNAALGYHTSMYAGMALIQAVTAYSMTIESLIPYGHWSGYSFKTDLANYSTALRRAGAYAKEWADANVTLVENPVDQANDFFMPSTRPCPTGTYAVSCGRNPDYVGIVCRCRYPQWDMSFNGKLIRSYFDNLAGACKAPSTARTANPCLAYAKYKTVMDQGKAEFEAQVAVQGYYDAADKVDAFNALNY